MATPSTRTPAENAVNGGPYVASLESYRTLVESIGDYAIFMLDRDGYIRSWNLGAEKIKGYTGPEIIGKHFSQFYTADALRRDWPAFELRMAERDGRFEDEGWRVRKDGSHFWANVVITALRDPSGKLTGFGKVTRDLTERRNFEQTLRESEETLRLLIESVKGYAISMLDPGGRVISWNSGAEQINGYRREEVIGQHFSLFYTPEALLQQKPERELATARMQGRAEDEDWRVRKDGSLYWANVAISAVYDAGGTLRGFALVTRDMSDRKRMEALEVSAQRMSEFLATLAHELRNPLAPVRNAINAMKLQPDDPLVAARCQGLIDRQITHLTRLVDDLLDVGRITAGKIALRLAPVRVGEIISLGVEAARPALDLRNQSIALHTPAQNVLLRADATRLVQVVQNLLLNAAKFSPPGSKIRISATAVDRAVILEISDPGCGISPGALEDIFVLFAQERDWHGEHGGGLGIGLSLCRSLVALHGGSISAASPGQGLGSTFTVRIPLGDVKDERAAAPVAQGKGQSLRALVVDDNRDSADSLALLLELEGHQVATAYEGKEALAQAELATPDIVLLDLAMPGLDGFAVIGTLRQQERFKATRFVAMTGFGQPSDRAQTKAAGFEFHLVKPIELAMLQQILAMASNAT